MKVGVTVAKDKKEKKTIYNSYNLIKFMYRERIKHEDFDTYHLAIYTRLVEINNLCRWVDVFGVPSANTMYNCCISDRRCYYKHINDLQRFGMIRMISKSKNKHESTQITLKTEVCEVSIKALMMESIVQERNGKLPVLLEYASKTQVINFTCVSNAISKDTHIKHLGHEAPNMETIVSDKPACSGADAPRNRLEKTSDKSVEPNILQLFEEYFNINNVDSKIAMLILTEINNKFYRALVMKRHLISNEEVDKIINLLVEFFELHKSSEEALNLKNALEKGVRLP